jgi:hypothetical protein
MLLLVVSTSCSKDFLDRTPSDQLSSETFFTQEKDLVYATNACYAAFAKSDWGDQSWGYSTTLLKIEVATDNAFDGHSWNPLYDIANGNGTTYDGYATYYWNERYRGIQRVNRALEGAEKIEKINPIVKANLVAQLKFLRAYFYFDLTYLFGDVPYYRNSITPGDVTPVDGKPAPLAARIDRNTILADMVKDLDDAAVALPDSYSGSDVGRVTKGAAKALKARILLTQASWAEYWNETTNVTWQDASDAAKAVIDLGTYQLYPDFDKLFTYDGIGNSEVIFDLQESLTEKQTNYTTMNFGPNSITAWSSGTPLQSLVNDFPMANGKDITDPASGYDPKKQFENRDPRLHATILYPGHEWGNSNTPFGAGVYNTVPNLTDADFGGKKIIPGDMVGDGTGGGWNKTVTGYNFYKYIMFEDFANGVMWDGSVHLILIRYTDILLMYAEAQAELGNFAEATTYINMIRARAGVGEYTSNVTLEDVRKERRIELAFEGLRLLDIRRWKIAQNVMKGQPEGITWTYDDGTTFNINPPVKRSFSDEDYLWPIPQTEVDVSKIEQNPGW